MFRQFYFIVLLLIGSTAANGGELTGTISKDQDFQLESPPTDEVKSNISVRENKQEGPGNIVANGSLLLSQFDDQPLDHPDDEMCIILKKKDCELPEVLLYCTHFCLQDDENGIGPRGFFEDVGNAWEEVKNALSKAWDFLSKLQTSLTKKISENLVLGCKPMTYNGVFHTGCTLHGSSDGREWCGLDGGVFWPGISNWKSC